VNATAAAKAKGRFERVEPFLRPHQVSELMSEKSAIEQTLQQPSHITAQIQNRGQMVKQARHIDQSLHENTPQPYLDAERDEAAKRERELREKWTSGMPTQAEMRRAPAGAVDKHRTWEAHNKRDIFEWKNIRLRMHASGMLDEHPDAREVANIEQFRPVYSPTELPMENKLVNGKDIFLPNGPVQVRNVMSDEDREAMRARDMELAAAAALAVINRLQEQAAAAAPAKPAK
jgi:hypothetical protein